ncbi:CPBP family intramembrane glutamic endopeptidase [Sphingomicrobium clamense]|uniref:CPBP family intramembrane metalloprotease n=1 Tax=Sphingomicrobium clamense TaxID=2851013 RepID=A0ABS6V4S2_9SPHN|nr:CPBP family intramembrane glutamic endopeptidase [Sphingomicrobium sp. B8]MBW0144544.1 CPBP family intramembrane metalloprotease [Sphingomicrobium sp. B8]
MLATEVVSALGQLAVVLVIVTLAWAIFGRRRAGWREWLGLGWPPAGWWKGALLIVAALAAIKIPLFTLTPLVEITSGENTVGGMLSGKGWSAEIIATILVMALVKTALTEEILFRGLIAKRLIGRLGFTIGNFLQALLFAGVHLLIFLAPGAPEMSLASVSAFFLLPFVAGWLMAYANERWGGGTIWPGWIIHGVGNVIAYAVFAAA